MRTVEMVDEVSEVLRQAVLVLIDQALDRNDKDLFLLLAGELKKMNNQKPGRESLEALTK